MSIVAHHLAQFGVEIALIPCVLSRSSLYVAINALPSTSVASIPTCPLQKVGLPSPLLPALSSHLLLPLLCCGRIPVALRCLHLVTDLGVQLLDVSNLQTNIFPMSFSSMLLTWRHLILKMTSMGMHVICHSPFVKPPET